MAFDPLKHHRRSIRLRGYDYAAAGGYFITTCAAQRRRVFGKIEHDVLRLHPYGRIVCECWKALPEHFPGVTLDECVMMPNHFHGIIIVGAGSSRPCSSRANSPEITNVLDEAGEKRRENPAPTLGQVMGYFKYQSTKLINAHRAARGLAPVVVWQRNYYERIIRDENELNDTRRYIIENPLNWESDENYVG